MNLLDDILGARTADLVAAVVERTQMNRDEAAAFVPEAGRSVAGALAKRAGDLDLANLASAANMSKLLDQIDVGDLVGKLGVSAEQGRSGLTAMLPMLLAFLSKNDAAMGGLRTLSGAGGALDALKDLGGGLFGK
jgi:hypothetical protein